MEILILDTENKSITIELVGAVSTNQLDFSSHYSDATSTTFTEGSSDGTTSDTTPVSVVSAPVASTRRIVKEITVYNNDTASATIIIKFVNGVSSRIIYKGIIPVGSTWNLTKGVIGNVSGPASSTNNNFVSFDGTTGQVVKDSGYSESDFIGSTLPSAQLFIGNALNVATATPMSGDAAIANTGVVTIQSEAVTYAKIQNVSATSKILGRKTAGAGSIEELSASDAKTILSLSNVENTALSTWAGTTNITTLGAIVTGEWKGTAIADSYISSAATWNAKQNALTFGIANTNSVVINSADVADNDYAKFTASGLEGRSYAEVLSDIGAQASHANLTSLAGLSYVSASFVKMTGAGTFALDTTSYLPIGGGTLTGNLGLDAKNITTDNTTGTKFGTATNQKIAFYNSTPIVQPTGSIKTALTNLGLVASPTISDAELTVTDVETNNASTSAHGFLKKLDNTAGHFMNGQGSWEHPVGLCIPAGYVANFAPADSKTYYWGSNWYLDPQQTAGRHKIYIPYTGTITAVQINSTSGVATAENSTMSIRVNDTTDYEISATIKFNAAYITTYVTGLTISIAAGDYIEIKWVTPAWATNPTTVNLDAMIWMY